VTVITRIFYSVNKCHSGRITSRQVRRSDLLDAFSLVDEEEDINKVTRYFSYEHFYVLYCRFWELDHDRDYRITREDLLKYGDHSLSHMIVDRVFDSAPRPFEQENVDREFLSYEDFIYFMLSGKHRTRRVFCFSIQYIAFTSQILILFSCFCHVILQRRINQMTCLLDIGSIV
jgi:serine/threonine-protein phosphatase 2A regulatory subunit B''